MAADTHTGAELESRKVAEAARETEWKEPSFLKELFLGRFRFDFLLQAGSQSRPPRPEFEAFFERFRRLVSDTVDPGEIDRTGEYPDAVVDGLRSIGAFGMKIPVEYGGLGLSQTEYNRVMEYLGSVDGNLAALLSAHQSIGVPQPIKLFGTPEQKARLLPRCAKGAISAFALTEPAVGSDPATLATTAAPTADGTAFVLNGEKLWCTNGTLAELLVVMARDPGSSRISAFVVEASSPGVTVEHRCRFMGLRAISNAVIRFDSVRVPRENLIGREGAGLKIALVTLNTGRLTIPAVCLGSAKLCLEIARSWAAVRAQWGRPVGQHEAIAQILGDLAATTYAMESVSDLAATLADRGGYDIRLEAAAAKEWNSTRAWWAVDRTLQVRGGRGYETTDSLAARGEAPIPVERMMRDLRINTIFEGSSEIMHLFMAREAVDHHLQVAGALVDPDRPAAEKLRALPRVAWFYARWYPSLWLGWGRWPRFSEFGPLATHVRFVERSTRKLARELFHGMVRHGARLERKQAFLFRAVDAGLELFAMAASIARAHALRRASDPNAERAVEQADLFCRNARRLVGDLFHALWSNDDAVKYRVARRVLGGDHAWLEEGIEPLGLTAEQIVPWTARPQAPPPAKPRTPAAHTAAELAAR